MFIHQNILHSGMKWDFFFVVFFLFVWLPLKTQTGLVRAANPNSEIPYAPSSQYSECVQPSVARGDERERGIGFSSREIDTAEGWRLHESGGGGGKSASWAAALLLK